MMATRWFTVLCIALVAGVVQAQPDDLRIAVSTEVECWNPLEGPCGASINYHDLVMETLVYWDDDLNLTPGLAVSWEAIDDLTWEIRLREGVTFTNGEPFDADAVVFMFDAIVNPEGRQAPTTQHANFRPLERIEVLDQYTLRFHTSDPYPLLVRYMAYEPRAVAPAYYQDAGMDEFGQRPIGTGPYQLIEWVKGDRFVLAPNPDHWAGVPQIQSRLVFRPIPEDTTRVAELISGGVHIAENIPGDLVPLLETSEDVRPVTVPGLSCVYVNLRPEDMFPNQALREVFFYATNRDEIINDLLSGYADPLDQGTCVTPYEFGYDPTIEPWEFDLEMAREKLEEAGYGGEEIQMYWPEGEVAQVDQLAEVLQAQWRRAGLNVSIHKMEYGLWRQNWSARTIPGHIFLKTSASKALDSDARLIPSVHCRDQELGYGRVSFYCNPDIDPWIREARVTVDEERRQELYSAVWAQHRDDAHHLTLYSPRIVYGMSNSLEWQPTLEGFWGAITNAVWTD
jgi:peptide/nickel transport system substrate-binding protein